MPKEQVPGYVKQHAVEALLEGREVAKQVLVHVRQNVEREIHPRGEGGARIHGVFPWEPMVPKDVER